MLAKPGTQEAVKNLLWYLLNDTATIAQLGQLAGSVVKQLSEDPKTTESLVYLLRQLFSMKETQEVMSCFLMCLSLWNVALPVSLT